jgi:hypothetical protein
MSDAVLLIRTIVGMRQKVVQITTPVNVFKRLVFLEKYKVLQFVVNSKAILFGARPILLNVLSWFKGKQTL